VQQAASFQPAHDAEHHNHNGQQNKQCQFNGGTAGTENGGSDLVHNGVSVAKMATISDFFIAGLSVYLYRYLSGVFTGS